MGIIDAVVLVMITIKLKDIEDLRRIKDQVARNSSSHCAFKSTLFSHARFMVRKA